MIQTGYGIPVRDGVGAGTAGKFFRRRRRRRRRRRHSGWVTHGCSRLRLLYKATTTIQGYNYSTRLRLLYKATTTKVSPLGRYPHSQKCIFFAPGKVPEISENPYFSSPRRSPRFPKIHILGPWGGPQSFESPYFGPPGRSPGFLKSHIFL